MKYIEAMKYIAEIGKLGSCYGLERTIRILELLDNPQNNYKIIHIAGTNGKGSTTAIITSLLMEKNFKVGMYTSPYLEEFEERIQVNRRNIPKEILGELMDKLKKAVDAVIKEGFSHPTEFEIITCLMYLYFSYEKVDYAVVEVGLGGRLDSTNVITPLVSVITSISFDHRNILGNTLEEIAFEKAGIIKNNVPVISYPQREEAKIEIEKAVREKNTKVVFVDTNNVKFLEVINEDGYYQRVRLNIEGRELIVNYPLLGEHQINNLLVALTAFIEVSKLEGFNVGDGDILNAIKKVRWIGRLEVLNRRPLVVIDGAHNIQGIEMLRENVEKYFKYKNIYLLLGILADKDVEKMIEIIAPIARKIYALTPNSERAELCEDLRKEILKYNKNCTALENYEEAYKQALGEAEDEDLILISGSLYMVGDMRKTIRKFHRKYSN